MMDLLKHFVNHLYVYLTGKSNINTNIIRIHNRKLQQVGDVSFPININNWSSLLREVPSNTKTIFEFLTHNENNENDLEKLIKISESWDLSIEKCTVIKDNVHLYLHRSNTFSVTIKEVIDKTNQYGSVSTNKDLNFNVKCDIPDSEDLNLSELRLKLLANTTKNFIHFCNGKIIQTTDEISYDSMINFTLKSSNIPNNCTCGPVLNNKGVKDVTTTANDFYEQRSIQMRLMAEHKYGLRITKQSGWKEFFEKLGHAAVIIELLQNKPNNTLTIDVNNHLVTSSKGAPFILYNCARLATLFKEFEKKVSEEVYLKLPDFNEINFGLLTQPEEWELLYVYILQFPEVIRNCIRDISESRIYPNYLISMLSAMCLCFSVYYRRVRILTEPKNHMLPTLYARIYLLKALERVLHNGLGILDIQPVKQM